MQDKQQSNAQSSKERLIKELKLLKSYFEDSREIVLHINDINWKVIDEYLQRAGIDV